MPTLVISTPWYKNDGAGQPTGRPGLRNSWETYYETHVGLGYMLYRSEYELLTTPAGDVRDDVRVVMLRNDRDQRRAEARLTLLEDTGRRTRNNQPRYHVHFDNPVEIRPYVYNLPEEKLKENGVKVIP